MGTWIDTGLYTQGWKAIVVKGDYADFDWTVKVDADAVLFPAKRMARINLLPMSPTDGFLANCEGVEYGFLGNLEAFSKTAFSILVTKGEEVDKDFHFAKRKHMGTWIDTGLYTRVCKAIAAKGDYADYDWLQGACRCCVLLRKTGCVH